MSAFSATFFTIIDFCHIIVLHIRDQLHGYSVLLFGFIIHFMQKIVYHEHVEYKTEKQKERKQFSVSVGGKDEGLDSALKLINKLEAVKNNGLKSSNLNVDSNKNKFELDARFDTRINATKAFKLFGGK